MRRFFLLCFLAIGCGEAPPPEPEYPDPPALPPQPVKTAEAEAPPPPEAPPRPPPEPVPEHLGTPASSLAAAPRWATREDKSYAPQPGGAESLFNEAAPAGEEAIGVACQFSVGNFRETAFTPAAALADMTVHASFSGPKGEKRPTLTVWGPEDTNTIYFVLPLASLGKGDEVVAEAIDRNVFSPDFLDRVRAVHKGHFPLAVHGRLATMECRALPRAAIEAHFAKNVPDVEEAIAKVESQKPDLTAAGFALSDLKDGGVADARWAMEYLAGLTGWDDPRVARRVARLDAAEAKIAGAIAAQADALRAKLPAPADSPTENLAGMLQVRSEEVACGPEVLKKYARYAGIGVEEDFRKTQCMVRVHLTNVSAEALKIDAFFGRIDPIGSMTLISKSGGRFPFMPFGEIVKDKPRRLQSDQPLAPGKSITLLAAVGSSPGNAPPDAPMLLRVSHPKTQAYEFARIE
jgi:hypothetical protein